jgi:tetratricopeptide (TPR) repeat protein
MTKNRVKLFFRRYIMLDFILLWVMIFFVFSPPVLADIPGGAGYRTDRQKEAMLQASGKLLDKDTTDRSQIVKVTSILREYERRFPNDIRIPLYLAKAYYRIAESADDLNEAYPDVEKTGFYAQKVLSMDPQRIEANYWYGLFLLRKAKQVSIFSAYFVAEDGINQLEKVRQQLPEYEHGGASRTLALLYTKAPGWSPFGDRGKAVFFAEESTRLAPDYLLNRVYLAEAYQKNGNKKAAVQELHKILSSSQANDPIQAKARSLLAEIE